MNVHTRSASAHSPILTRDDLRRIAPSIFAEAPWGSMSSRYKYVPTVQVLDFLEDHGYKPVRADQSNTRIPGKSDFTRHLIRFRHSESFDLVIPRDGLHRINYNEGPLLQELVLVNSHDGSSGVQLSGGLYRQVCANGLVVHNADLGSISVRHTGGQDYYERLSLAVQEVTRALPGAAARADEWRQLALPAPVQAIMAREALAIRGLDVEDPETPTVRPTEALRARRQIDRMQPDGTRDLWTTLNVVQENVLRGGLRGEGSTGRRYTSRAVKSVAEDLRINRKVWSLAEEIAAVMKGQAAAPCVRPDVEL